MPTSKSDAYRFFLRRRRLLIIAPKALEIIKKTKEKNEDTKIIYGSVLHDYDGTDS